MHKTLPQFNKINYRWSNYTEQKRYEEKVTTNLLKENINYQNINKAYDSVIQCVSSAAETSLTKRQFKKFLKPYWSPSLKQFHCKMLLSRRLWITTGKCRDSLSYVQYKTDKCNFRRNLRRTGRI